MNKKTKEITELHNKDGKKIEREKNGRELMMKEEKREGMKLEKCKEKKMI